MAVDSELYQIPGLKAEQDVSTLQFRAVELSAAFQVDVCDNAADLPVGVLQNKPAAAGRAAEIRSQGITKWEAGGTVAFGDKVGTDSVGRAVAKTANNAIYIGIALEGAVVGDIFSVLLQSPSFVGA